MRHRRNSLRIVLGIIGILLVGVAFTTVSGDETLLDEYGNPASPDSEPPGELEDTIGFTEITIGIDNRNAFAPNGLLWTGEDFTEFQMKLTDRGHTIVPLSSFESVNPIDFDVIILKQPFSIPFSELEITTIHSFVELGGDLLFAADSGGDSDQLVENVNQLLAPFGVTVAQTATNGEGWTVTGFLTHPITVDVEAVGVDFQRPLSFEQPPPAAPPVDLTLDDGSSNVLAVVDGGGHGGRGNVVIVSDSSMWSDADSGADTPIGFEDNELLLDNVLDVITGSCGDGRLDQPGETCDPEDEPAGANDNLCRSDCTVCGDAVVDAGEDCDDGNTDPSDACDNDCNEGLQLVGACCTDGPGLESECIVASEIDCVAGNGLFVGAGTDCELAVDCEALFVSMHSMSAATVPAGVLLRWTTALEIDTVGFRVMREMTTREKAALQQVGPIVPALGSEVDGGSYEVLDDSPAAARAIHYYVEDIDLFGRVTRHGPIVVERGERRADDTRQAERPRHR